MTVGPHRHAAEAMRAWRADQEKIHAWMKQAAEDARRKRLEHEAAERWEASMKPLVEALELVPLEFPTTVRTCVCGRRFSQEHLVERALCSACSRDMLPSRNPLLTLYDEVEAMARAKLAIKRADDAFTFNRSGDFDNPHASYLNRLDTENAILEELGYA